MKSCPAAAYRAKPLAIIRPPGSALKQAADYVSVEYANIYRMWFFVSQVGRGFEAYAVALDGAISDDIRVVEK
jgi:hypothetical protein